MDIERAFFHHLESKRASRYIKEVSTDAVNAALKTHYATLVASQAVSTRQLRELVKEEVGNSLNRELRVPAVEQRLSEIISGHLTAFAKTDASKQLTDEYKSSYVSLIAEEQRRLQQESKKWEVAANDRLRTLERNLIMTNVTLASVTTVLAAYLVYLDSKR